MALSVTVGDGKYTVEQTEGGKLTALRYGSPWRDLCGDGLVYTLAAELQTAREQIVTLTSLCHRAGDVMDAALTCPDDAGYQSDAATAVEELQGV